MTFENDTANVDLWHNGQCIGLLVNDTATISKPFIVKRHRCHNGKSLQFIKYRIVNQILKLIDYESDFGNKEQLIYGDFLATKWWNLGSCDYFSVFQNLKQLSPSSW